MVSSGNHFGAIQSCSVVEPDRLLGPWHDGATVHRKVEGLSSDQDIGCHKMTQNGAAMLHLMDVFMIQGISEKEKSSKTPWLCGFCYNFLWNKPLCG